RAPLKQPKAVLEQAHLAGGPGVRIRFPPGASLRTLGPSRDQRPVFRALRPGRALSILRSEVRILQPLPARCRRLSRLHSICLVNRCDGLQRPECAVAEQLLQPRGLEDARPAIAAVILVAERHTALVEAEQPAVR